MKRQMECNYKHIEKIFNPTDDQINENQYQKKAPFILTNLEENCYFHNS